MPSSSPYAGRLFPTDELDVFVVEATPAFTLMALERLQLPRMLLRKAQPGYTGPLFILMHAVPDARPARAVRWGILPVEILTGKLVAALKDAAENTPVCLGEDGVIVVGSKPKKGARIVGYTVKGGVVIDGVAKFA